MDELKIVISLRGEKGSVGVQAPGCDPVFLAFEGGLEEALGRVPGLVSEARERWERSPLYPRTPHELAPAPQSAQAQVQIQRPRPVETRGQWQQQSLF